MLMLFALLLALLEQSSQAPTRILNPTNPNPMPGESEIEIRQVFDAQDFGEAYTPDLQKQDEKIRETIRARS